MTTNNTPDAFFWHRRDLRIDDNAGLWYALKNELSVQPIFVFDTDILEKLSEKNDRRVDFIHRRVSELKTAYRKVGGDLWVFYGTPVEILKTLIQTHHPLSIYTNSDYEPYARQRDAEVEKILLDKSIRFVAVKDHVIFDPREILKDDGRPYMVFTPYANKWHAMLDAYQMRSYPTRSYLNHLHQPTTVQSLITLQQVGFDATDINADTPTLPDPELLQHYQERRNFPAIEGTSRLSVHFRFGTISVRNAIRHALPHSHTWSNEMAWRDFYHTLLWHYPQHQKAFKPAYDRIPWRDAPEEFERWCSGNTGYALVDAGMRELNATGFMHNRVRMLTASFLTKHLLIDWRWGEDYFAKKLIDFDLAANNGGWQWASGSGCDAAPYFRIFNPTEQAKKYDPQSAYIRRWIPEIDSTEYPTPMIEHSFARERALRTYKAALDLSNFM